MKSKYTLPNALTTLRLLLTVPLVILILQEKNVLALIVFVIAITTEIDGTVARKLNQATAFGAVYDPIVDGIFAGGGIIALLAINKLPLLLIALLVAANIPRLIFMYLFHKKWGKFGSTIWTKLSGLLGTLIIPLAILDFPYLYEYIIGVIILTTILMIGVGKEYFRK